MTGRVYVEISTANPSLVLALREEIQNLNPDIVWLYDDAMQVLEMAGWQKWWAYAQGHIIVVATNETDARRFATLEVREYMRQRTEDYFLEEDARQELLDIALRDLEAEPEQALSLLITGRE